MLQKADAPVAACRHRSSRWPSPNLNQNTSVLSRLSSKEAKPNVWQKQHAKKLSSKKDWADNLCSALFRGGWNFPPPSPQKFSPVIPKVDAARKKIPGLSMKMAASLEITTTQLFNLPALNALYNKRTEFDSTTANMVKSIYNNRKKGIMEGQQEVVYRLSRSKAGQLGYGRLYGPKSSIEKLQSECRATVCREYYHDLDIVNCQPTLMEQLVKKELGVEMPSLSSYVAERDAFLLKLIETHDMNRDDAKDAVIRVLFGETNKYPELAHMSFEVRAKAKELSKLPRYAELFAAVKNEKNMYGSFLSFAAQTEERKCMLAMRQFLMERDWSVDVLCYDGIMVRRRTGVSITEELLEEMVAYVKEQTGYDIQIKEKEQIGFSDLKPIYEDPTETVYKDMKAEFEKNHFYFTPTNTICEVSRRDGIFHFNLEHAMIAFNGMILPGGKDDELNLFIKKWIKDPHRRIVKNLVYKNPDDCADDEASLFTGFAFEEMIGADATAWELFMDIVKACAGDSDEITHYLIRYLAHMIQKPFEIPGVAIIFSSETHGTGKDTLLNVMRRIIGRHSKHYCSESQFWNGHDTGKEGTILAHLEEVGSAANKAKKNELKALITADSININPKGVKAYDIPNVMRIMMTTNEPDPVKVEESDRRFLIINPSTRLHARGLSWWASIQEQLASPAFLGTVGNCLSTINLEGWNPRTIPMTEAKKELAEASKAAEILFLEDYTKSLSGLTVVNPTELYKEYRRWYKEQEMDQKFMRISAQSLAIHVSRYASKVINGFLFTKGTDGTNRFYRFTPAA